MTPSQNCLDLIEKSEGLRLKSYRDTGGVWTIGYGHTAGVRAGQTITQEIAEELLKQDIEYAVRIVNSNAGPCTQNQFDALVDFVFNVGPSLFLSSTLLRKHKAGDHEGAAAEFPKWKYDNHVVQPGLVTRRAAERLLYEGKK
jgi:lysozyme